MDFLPKARSAHLIVRDLDQETLVYDTKTHHATCLSALARDVWRLCDGTRNIDDIAESCQGDLINTEVIHRTLLKLSKSNLLEEPYQIQHMESRRSVVGKLAGTASLAMAVTAISVPAASQGASCLPRFEECINNSDCCSGICRNFGWFAFCA